MAAELRASVLIPAYNEAARIGRALESVRAQTLPPYEVLVVDDGSTDATGRVAASYGARVIATPNRGISAARNRGLREATGDWIALLDADDAWSPDRLAALARAVALRPAAGFVFSDYVVEEAGVPNAPSNLARTAQYVALPREPLAADVAFVSRDALGAALAVGNFLGTSTVSVRRELVLAHASFDEALPERTADYQLSEDVDWYLRVLAWTDALAIDAVLARYVRRPESYAEAHGRVRFGDVKLGERIARDPAAYAPGAAAAFAAQRRPQLRHAAALYAREADFAHARSVLALAQRESFAWPDAVRAAAWTLADCGAGRSAATAARSFWRRTLRPAIRSFRAPRT